MGFYNMVFGTNPMADALLATLGLTRNDVGRFRDCFISNGTIAVYTRNGGGNRGHWGPKPDDCDCWECTIPNHPNYLYDEDDGFDCTYATIYFSFPEEYKEQLEALDSGESFDPDARWLAAIEALKRKAG